MANKSNLLDDIEAEVNEQDIIKCQQKLSKPDRVGKFAVILCTILFAFAGWHIVDNMVVDTPVQHPWYSKVPLIGDKIEKKFWEPPKATQLPVIGKTIHDKGMFKFGGLVGGIVIGFLIGKVISALIRNGAKQDERNRRKVYG